MILSAVLLELGMPIRSYAVQQSCSRPCIPGCTVSLQQHCAAWDVEVQVLQHPASILLLSDAAASHLHPS